MDGHRELITMRRAGFKPAFVFVNDFPCQTDWAKWGDHPTICVAGDTPELQDFRFLVGVTAIVGGTDAERVRRVAKACQAHAKRVIASVAVPVTEHRMETTTVTDTEDEFTWPT